MGIRIGGITKYFGSYAALRDIDLEVQSGELVALLGPSGSGKTTLLRIIAGLEGADEGTVELHGEDATAKSPRDRRVGFVFQHYALFRHLSVFENVAFGLRVRPRKMRPSKSEIRQRVMELLHLVQLDRYAERYPAQLSGGQRQRVALARALAVEPKVLLLDEPFGALDAKVRKELRAWLRRLHDEIHVTSVFVTHDQEEALEVADRVVIMNEGRIEQVGTPEAVFHHPRTEFVMRFLGETNDFHGRVDAGMVQFGSLRLPYPEDRQQVLGDARVFIRPHDLTIDTKSSHLPSLQASVTRIQSAGPVVRVELRMEDGQELAAELSQERFGTMHLDIGSRVNVRPRHIRVFAAGGAHKSGDAME